VNLLCIDIGNTNVVSGLYKNDTLINVQRIETKKDIIDKNLNLSVADDIAISSVVPKIEEYLINSTTTKSVFSISHINTNIKLNVDVPGDVGNDRLCNMKSIIKNNQFPAIIIDFGSATTYDIINQNGEFVGGVIAPGTDVSAQYLFERAAQLNSVPFKFPKSVIGTTTKSNLQSGIMYGGVDAVNGMIKRIKKEVDYDFKNIILTGGFSSLLSKKIIPSHTVNANLTLEGIKYIWEENQ